MSSRTPLIAGNWKMNGLQKQGRDLVMEVIEGVSKAGVCSIDMVVCPPYTLLGMVAGLVAGSPISLGGQDCHCLQSGAHTGDVSAQMLKDVRCEYVIVGHSERRSDHGETDMIVRQKALAAHAAGLVSIVCVGETEAQRLAGETFDVIREQVLGSVPQSADHANTVLAYEPVWAIGTGKVATPQQVQEIHHFVRATLAGHMGEPKAQSMRIIYGGSMKPGNAQSLLGLPDVDGGLIGGAALNAEEFVAIIKLAS
jgi:triosephosphate isomerase (TIM)